MNNQSLVQNILELVCSLIRLTFVILLKDS